MPATTIGQWFSMLGAQFPDRPALIQGGRIVTFAELDLASRRVAAGLSGLGIGKGDRVAVWLPSYPEWIILFLACARIGAATVSLNTRFRAAELSDVIGRSRARALVLSEETSGGGTREIVADLDRAIFDNLRHVVFLGAEEFGDRLRGAASSVQYAAYRKLAEATPADDLPVDPDSVCLIWTTSGTTRRPKLVQHCQRAILGHARAIGAVKGAYDEKDSHGLTMMPLGGAFGLTQTMAALVAGAPTVLELGFDATLVSDHMRRYRVTNLAATDDVLIRLAAQQTTRPPFPDLRYAMFGAFNSSPEEFMAMAGDLDLPAVGAYGMSEVQGLLAFHDIDSPPALRALGGGRLTHPDAHVRVRDLDTGRLLGFGERGMLEFRAPSAMVGYFEDDAANAEFFLPDGYVRSGDIGYLHDDRTFVFISRHGDVMRVGGFLVSPVEISHHVEQHPSVEECQVVAVLTEQGGRPVAFIRLAQGHSFDPEALAEHCRVGLAKFKNPIRYIPVDKMPVTDGPNGVKVQREALRAMAQEICGKPRNAVQAQ